jgi:hypothetical protein
MSLAMHFKALASLDECDAPSHERRMRKLNSPSLSPIRRTSTPEKRPSNNNIGRFSARHDDESTASLI